MANSIAIKIGKCWRFNLHFIVVLSKGFMHKILKIENKFRGIYYDSEARSQYSRLGLEKAVSMSTSVCRGYSAPGDGGGETTWTA